MGKVSFKEQMLRSREEAIVTAASRLLADKGFDLMTVDEVAAEVGVAKASLYKHFSSKEALAAAAMVRILDRALAHAQHQVVPEPLSGEQALALLRSVVHWTMEVQLAGDMPSLPAQNSVLRAVLSAHTPYLERLMTLSDLLGHWIVVAQEAGLLRQEVPAEVILYSFFAKACDPVLSVLKASGNYTDETIISLLMKICFEGLAAPSKVSERP